MAESWITDEMRAGVGRVIGYQVSMPIAVSDIRKWAQAVYYPGAPPRRFWDESYAATTRFGGIVAPEEFNPFAWMTAEGPPDTTSHLGGGPEEALGIEAPRTQFMLNGGMACTYSGVGMRADDVVVSEARLVEYTERVGRLGLMLFTTTETAWTNQNAESIKTARNTLIRY